MYIDAHCHLERDTYGDELDEVIARAQRAGLTHFVAVGASGVARGALEVVELAERHPAIFAAVGIHPHDAACATPDDEATIAALLSRPKVVALGEIGLDYHYDHSPQDVQRQVFSHLLALGRARNVPVMLHVREAHDDTFELLDAVGLPPRGGVVHCFTAGPHEAREYLRRGMMLSIPGVVTFKNAEPLRAALSEAPLERLLLETDCPYLAPLPYRGQRNEPAYLTATAAALGAVKGLSGEEMGALTRQNALRFFGLPGEPSSPPAPAV
jgi:TatD DNase family protein